MLAFHFRKYQWRQVQMCLSTSAKKTNKNNPRRKYGFKKGLNDRQKRLTECRNSFAETANCKLSTRGALTLLLLLPVISFNADLAEIGRFSLGLGRSGSQQAGPGTLKAAPLVEGALSAAAPSTTCTTEHPIIECSHFCPSDLMRQSVKQLLWASCSWRMNIFPLIFLQIIYYKYNSYPVPPPTFQT